MKDVLKTGSGRVFLFRSWRKHPTKSWPVLGPALLLLLDGWGVGIARAILECCRDLLDWSGGRFDQSIVEHGVVGSVLDWVVWPCMSQLLSCLSYVMPTWGLEVWESVGKYCSISPQYTQAQTAVARIIWIVLWLYFVLFLTYVVMRRMVRRWDIKDYRSLTGQLPSDPWK